MPWFFNRHLIFFHKLEKGEDLIQVLITSTNFWVQIHNHPLGCMSKGMARELGNFIGEVLVYDAAIIAKGINKYMRIKVKLDVRNPLRRRKCTTYGHDKTTFTYFNTKSFHYFVSYVGGWARERAFVHCDLRQEFIKTIMAGIFCSELRQEGQNRYRVDG